MIALSPTPLIAILRGVKPQEAAARPRRPAVTAAEAAKKAKAFVAAWREEEG